MYLNPEMFNAEAIEFPFVKEIPKREKSRMGKLWEHFQEVKSKVAEVGMILPQDLAAELLGVSKQRVCELIELGRLEALVLHGHRWITERSFVALAQSERKAGRPPKVPSTGQLAKFSWEQGKAVMRKAS